MICNFEYEEYDGVQGYRESYLKSNLDELEYKDLCNFMRGQTVMVLDNDESFIYKSDFDRWNR